MPEFESTLFSGSGLCGGCHDSDGVALTDNAGASLSIVDDWSGSMMAMSFHDPIFRAKIKSEIKRHPGLQSVIEDKCTRCHTPMARAQYYWDGGDSYPLEEAEASRLADDGVSCTVCHQIKDSNLGQEDSFSGQYDIDGSRTIYGPYSDVFTGPMINHVGYTPAYAEHIHASALCATCHTLYTPFIDNEGEIRGELPEQTPFLEWLNSDYAAEEDGRACHDCHLPRIEEGVILSSRPPWLSTLRSPFGKHHLVGGNTFAPALLRDHPAATGVEIDPARLDTTIERARAMLKTAAEIQVVEVSSGDPFEVALEVRNLIGHKLPTGFPSRRAWLYIKASTPEGATLFESGAWDAEGRIAGLDAGFEPHRDVIAAPGDVVVYEAVMGDVDDAVTYTLLRGAKFLKDNRLPPRGYLSGVSIAADTAIHGQATGDADFNRLGNNEGTGADRVTIRLPLGAHPGPIEFEAALIYQPFAPRFADDLADDAADAEEIENFAAWRAAANMEPETIAEIRQTIVPADAAVIKVGFRTY